MDSRELKKAGLKATQPRLRILSVLEQNPEHHMSAEDVYRALIDAGDEVGLATVYRVLTQFETAGLVIRHHFEEGRAVFELESGNHHDHLICMRCGSVTEFVDEDIELRQRMIANKFDFKISDHSLVIYGECSKCRANASAADDLLQL